MTWEYIARLLGPGLHWGKSQQEIQAAIERAMSEGKHDAAAHLEIILARRNRVMFEKDSRVHKSSSMS